MGEFRGRIMMQEQQDLDIWDKFFEKYPVKTFLELGTGYGGLTMYFGLTCNKYGVEFHTFDNIQSTDFQKPDELEIELSKSFHLVDIFSDAGISLIRKLIKESPKPVVVFFDDGNKPREWKTFAPDTSPGDFCAVHDWGTEFGGDDIAGVPVERIFVEECETRRPGFLTMWFKRI